MASKADIRAAGKRARAALSADVRARFDAAIIERCQTELDWDKYRRVMVYLPIARNHEIDTWPLVRWIWEHHPRVAVYVPVGHGSETGAVRISPDTTFAEDSRGIPQPNGGEPLTAGETLDLIITALLGFDDRGYRIGYGGGFYDRFLSLHPEAQRAGLAYEALGVDVIPVEHHDVPLEVVITETQIRLFRSR